MAKIPVREGFYSRPTSQGEDYAYVFRQGEVSGMVWKIRQFGTGKAAENLTGPVFLQYHKMENPARVIGDMRRVADDMERFLKGEQTIGKALDGELDSD